VGFRKLGLGGVEALLWVDERLSRKLVSSATKPIAAVAKLLSGRLEAEKVKIFQPPSEVSPRMDERLRGLVPRIDAIEWYHTIEIADGLVAQGVFDLRPYLPLYKLPADLSGQRVLDIASFDGFWAFEFEKRKASEVIAMDIESFAEVDFPPGVREKMTPEQLEGRKTKEGFELVREVKKSKVKLEYCNVYDLAPSRMGMFDFVFSSDLLLHLRDPAKAVQNMRKVTAPGGCAYIADCFHPGLPGNTVHYEGGQRHSTWWIFGFRALEQMIRDAGFSKVELVNKFKTGGRGQKPWIWHAVFRATP
jgi:tRNA (mo5U34)-methyltransferase